MLLVSTTTPGVAAGSDLASNKYNGQQIQVVVVWVMGGNNPRNCGRFHSWWKE